MFSIGFFELLTVMLVALFVLGPARLPQAVHGVVGYLGKAQRWWVAVQADLEHSVDPRGMRERLHKEMEQVGLAQGAANTSPDRLNLDMQQALKPQHFFDVSKLPHALTEAEVKP